MPSRFAHYLNTNHLLSDEEMLAIRDAIRKGKKVLNDIDQETYEIEQRTEELRQELRSLAERREAQEREVDEYVAILQSQSPIKHVNDDILASIFLSVLDVVNDRNLELSPKHPAVVISHVCQRWRELALSTKLLWRHLHIEIPAYHPGFPDPGHTWKGKLSKLAETVEVWISRSYGCPLSVKVHEEPLMRRLAGASIPECIEFHKLLEQIRSSSPRWKDLDLKITQEWTPKTPTMCLLTILPQDTPALTKVKFDSSFPLEAFQLESPPNQKIFSGSALRSLEIGSLILTHNSDILRMPVIWSNLKHLVFEGYPATYTSSLHFGAPEALALFKECPNLVTCYLAFQKGVTIPTDRAPIELRGLEELSLLPFAFNLPKGFATSLILPSLRTFKCITGQGMCLPRGHRESGLFEFFECFGSTLEDVAFCYTSLTQTALHCSLRLLPNVTSLQLDCPLYRANVVESGGLVAASLDTDTLMLLTPQFNAEGTAITRLPLCPSLEVLRFSGGGRGAGKDALVGFIAARRRVVDGQPSRLREVQVSSMTFSNIDLGQALRNRGIDTTVSSLRGRYRFT